MCGIYLTNIAYKKSEVKDKLKLMNFRGPDNTGFHKKNNISLGHVRLSILDIDERSNQPYIFENYILTYNGEIYNFQDLKKELIELGYEFSTSSDTEVLIKGYAEWAEKLLPKLNGMFAFAIYDSVNEEVFCARDRVGVKPFYYYIKDGDIEICSQLSPLINKNSEISEKAISIYLDCGYIPSPYSILENVFKLKPGNYLIFNLKNKTHKTETYWDLKKPKLTDLSYDEAKKELHRLLIDAVKIRLQSDVPLGSFLSGGIDSALVSAIASKTSKDQLNTYTIGFKDPKYDESQLAKRFSEIINSNHTETICSANDVLKIIPKLLEVYDEPFADSSALPSLLLCSVTKENVSVALSGDGGDESFIGYNGFDVLKKFQKIEWIPFFLRKNLKKLNLEKIIKLRPETIETILSTKNVDEFSWKKFTGFNVLQKDSSKFDWGGEYQSFKIWSDDPIQRMADLNIKLWLENDSNVKVDRASMAYSMEVRSPFLDYRIIEFARSLPIEYRYKNGVKKRILKDILAEYISPEEFNVPKKGFSIPLGDWIRNELNEEISNTLNNDFLITIPNLDIEKFKRQFQAHMESKYDYSFNIWKVYLLAKWMKSFNEKNNLVKSRD